MRLPSCAGVFGQDREFLIRSDVDVSSSACKAVGVPSHPTSEYYEVIRSLMATATASASNVSFTTMVWFFR
jgi:hypothetical protein